MLYFIQSQNWFKVGYTTNPTKRLATYQTYNPILKIWGLKEGSEKDEKAYHKRFKQYPVKAREWFQLPQEEVDALKEEFTISFKQLTKNQKKKIRIISKCKKNPKDYARTEFHFYCRASKIRVSDLTAPIEISFYENGKRRMITTEYRWDPLDFAKKRKKEPLKQLLKDLKSKWELHLT